MSYVSIQDLLPKTASIYKLVLLAARRAMEINSGAAKLVDNDNQKISSIVLKEIAQGKVRMGTAAADAAQRQPSPSNAAVKGG